MALTITIPGAIEATTGATAPAVLTVGVGIPGPGVPTGGTAGQVLKKLSSTNYDTAWQTDLNSGVWGSITGTLSSQTDLQNALDAKLGTSTAESTYAPLVSPSLSGTPLAPTATSGDNSTQIATTAFVQGAIISGSAHAETLQATVRNSTGSTLAPFTVVYINGATGNKATVAKAQANAEATSAGTYAVTESSIANNADGNVIAAGVLSNIDTSAFTDGDKLYLSPTVAGGVTTTKPSAPNHLVYVGVVTRSHPNQGTVSVRIQNGYELDELHNVAAQTPSDLDLLSYESSTSLWKNKSFSTLGLATQSWVTSQGYLTSSSLSGYAQLSGATFTGEVATPASTTSSAGFSIAPGTAPSAPTNGEIWNSGTDLIARISGVSETLARQSWVTSQSYLTTSSAASTYAAKAGATFTGLVTTVASATGTAGFNLPHGAAPTTPVNGDVWTTTGGFFWRQNGTTYQAVNLSGTQTVSGAITFSNSALTLGNSTAASTYNLGTGATLTATTKAINIGTNGVAGSTTNIAIGSTTGTNAITINGPTTLAGTVTASGTTLDLGNSAGTATYSLGSGTTTTGLTKTVNIGTNGGTGSTTNITLGTSVGSTTTNIYGAVLQGGGTGVTAAADNNTTALATTAFVVGQAGSATPLVDGTAAVGTSLRYARQDHVHPTDTSRAALASPTFTGTPAAPTATADTNTTQLATTAFVVGQASSTAPVIDGTATVGTSLKYARADHVHPTDTSRAALASPTFTGVPAAPTAAVDTNTTQLATTAYVVGQGYAKLASPALSGTPTAPTATAGTNTTQVATTAFVQAALPAFASVTQSRAGTSTTVTQNPSTNLWQMMNPGFIPIVRGSLSYTATGTMGASGIGSYTSRMTMGTAGAASGSFRVFGGSQIDQAWICVSKGYRSYIDFSRVTWCSGRFYTEDTWTDPQLTAAFYFGKANNSADGDLARAGFGWKLSGNATAGSRNPVLQVHNGTTLTNVTTSFALVAQVYFDWDIVSLGNGTVTLYINGTQYATTSAGPTGDTSYSGTTPVIWNEELKSTGTTAAYNATFSRGTLYIAP